MREEARKRLERELLLRRLKGIAPVALVALAIAGAFYFQSLDTAIVKTDRLDGTVVYVGPLQGKYAAAFAEKNFQVDVKLGDTRVAHLVSQRDAAPKVGDHVTVADHVHGTGRHTFGWK